MMLAKWFDSKNWGDALNPVLIKMISGETPHNMNHTHLVDIVHNPVYLVVGSILEYADKNSVVWGAGFISKDSKVVEPPKKIYAVRGPLTRELLIEQGIPCPGIYGDPALLLPRYYNPTIEKKYKMGFIPHYAEWDSKIAQTYNNDPTVLTIDITSGIYNVVNQILSCDRIESSALHGLIIADAYSIPSTWLHLSNKIIGGWFKFNDYFEAKKYVNLDKLMSVCPFKKVK